MRTIELVRFLLPTLMLVFPQASSLDQLPDQRTELQKRAAIEREAQKAEVQEIQRISDEAEIWYLEPTTKDWSKFRWKKIRGNAKSGIARLIKGAIVSDRAGMSFTLDLPAETKRERAEGFAILKGPDGGFSGFVRRANFEEKSSLKLITVNSFISEKEVFSWSPKPWFVGIVTEVSITSLLRAD
ncbi:hypothetical protein OJ996_16580 [Luteolibacter sp. GHJ8]|uniref:Uncharacterized protein n=1 Tax=Luteolibacter rhizosphaerae TaxID=2989719 RepID=A0ABT3G6J9_9BACT|nr:hypothetical protein [Luteolibacter rhizosphaerae]MCW1915204.1 hypothetical protein [Luteolibacter rhizosphaerae]